MDEECQLCDDAGNILPGQGAPKRRLFSEGLLHGAAHIWVWRDRDRIREVLLQRRALDKSTWPGLYGMAAGGHMSLGETPIETVCREAKEEIGLVVDPTKLRQFEIYRINLIADTGHTENEVQWLYSYEVTDDHNFVVQLEEVDSVVWKSFDEFIDEITDQNSKYLPFGDKYYAAVVRALSKPDK